MQNQRPIKKTKQPIDIFDPYALSSIEINSLQYVYIECFNISNNNNIIIIMEPTEGGINFTVMDDNLWGNNRNVISKNI